VRTEKGLTSKGQQNGKKRWAGYLRRTASRRRWPEVVAGGSRSSARVALLLRASGLTKERWRLGQGEADGEDKAPTWAGLVSKMGHNVSSNGPKWPDTYQPKYPIFFLFFFFGYLVDTYPWSIGYVSVSNMYPTRIRQSRAVSVFCRFLQLNHIFLLL